MFANNTGIVTVLQLCVVCELQMLFVWCVQIYVEVERARLTLDLAKIKEDQGDIAGAATILQDLQV